jgi:hypothetical protein
MKYVLLWSSFCLLFNCDFKVTSDSSYWSADAPIYTTYAAAMERSEFLIDQGYEFQYDKKDKPLTFFSQKGGEMGLVFLIDGQLIENIGDYFEAPVILESYPDMVYFKFFPVKDVEVIGRFLVQSSRLALQEFEWINHRPSSIKVEMIPFMGNDYRTFGGIRMMTDQSIYFRHEKYPDNWSLGQQIPYQDSLQNLWVFSEPIKEWGAFTSFGEEMGRPSFEFNREKAPHIPLFGRAYQNGERLMESGPNVRMLLQTDRNDTFVLTENAPIWGSPTPAIDQDGLFRFELGNLPQHAQDSELLISYLNLKRGVGDRLKLGGFDQSARVDFHTQDALQFQAVSKIEKQLKGNKLQLSWNPIPEASAYKIYKRVYPIEGFYRLIAKVDDPFFEEDMERKEAYTGYLILPEGEGNFIHSEEIYSFPECNFKSWVNNLRQIPTEKHQRVIGAKFEWVLDPKSQQSFRIARSISEKDADPDERLAHTLDLFDLDFKPFLQDNEALFANVPKLSGLNTDEALLYKSAWNMMRQVMYPPEGKSPYNYYVFSREPTWGWGHGGQVFHESITMLAYAYLDPLSAMNSQRVYAHRQYENGYINYRTGSYLDEIIEYKGQLTSSAPWYSWLNWEIYSITKDRQFLEEIYDSSKKFYNFYISERDSDGDGLLEWGGHAILESVRDALVAVWDEVGWPSNFESVDLNCMMVMEAKSLESMALELGLQEEASHWKKDHVQRAKLINEVFWDEENGFYYNVNKSDNSFTFKSPNDLKRDEIIGFLPLWAGVADQAKAERLLEKLKDPNQFWRRNGIPSLSAADSYYNDKGYWNGPVWVEWNYLIFKGLKDYGYHKEAAALTDNIAAVMISQLKENHNLWEFYSPDEDWAGYHKTYIWAGIINRMLMDK